MPRDATDQPVVCAHCGGPFIHLKGELLTPPVEKDYPAGGLGYRGHYIGHVYWCENCQNESAAFVQEHKGGDAFRGSQGMTRPSLPAADGSTTALCQQGTHGRLGASVRSGAAERLASVVGSAPIVRQRWGGMAE